MTDEELQRVADQVFTKLESRFHALDGVVGARGAKGEDGKQGERGLPGRDAQDGKDGKAGDSSRLIIVYKVTETDSSPGNPTGGTWDYLTNTVTPPAGWTESAPNHESGYLWSAQAVFSSNGTQLQAWTQPIRLNGKDGGDGEDASDIEYVYKLTKNKDEIPSVPTNSPDISDFTGDWSDNPHGITEEMKAEWMCSRLKQADGKWGNWIGPTLWSVWGSAGKDGDGVQYVYKTTEDKEPPEDIAQSDNEQLNEFIPQGWTDDPTGVSEEVPFEWVSKRKFDGTNQVWGEWSKPKLWASWGKKGDTGLSATFRYQSMVKYAEKPVIEDRKRPEPGDQWQKLVPELEEGKVIWACQALVYEDGSVYCDESLPEDKQGWQGPWQISGADGDKGKTGPEPDYTSIVFKKSDLKPAKPTGTSIADPGDGWQVTVPVETSEGNWWGCWGRVTHVDNPEYDEDAGDEQEVEEVITSVEWGDPLPLNGNMGNPCILASFQAKANHSGTTWGMNEKSLNTAISDVNVTYNNSLATVTLTPKAGYQVKVTSANANIGTTHSFTCKDSTEKRYRSNAGFYSCHVLIDNSTNGSPKIYVQAFAQENKNNDSSYNYLWTNNKNQSSYTMTIYGTVIRTATA